MAADENHALTAAPLLTRGSAVEAVSRGRAKQAEALSEAEGSGVCGVRITMKATNFKLESL